MCWFKTQLEKISCQEVFQTTWCLLMVAAMSSACVCVCVAFPSKLQRYCWSWRLGRRLISATNVHLQDHEHYFCHGMYFTIMKSIWYKIEQTPHTVDIHACLLICVKCSLDHLIAIFHISRSSLRTSLCAPVLDRWLVIVVWLRVHKSRHLSKSV